MPERTIGEGVASVVVEASEAKGSWREGVALSESQGEPSKGYW